MDLITGSCRAAEIYADSCSDVRPLGTIAGSLQGYPDRLPRAREILEMTVEAAVQKPGPKEAATQMAIRELASFNHEHGAVLEAEAAIEFAVKQLEEFALTSEATQGG